MVAGGLVLVGAFVATDFALRAAAAPWWAAVGGSASAIWPWVDALGLAGALEFLSTHPTGSNRQAQVANLQKEGTPALDDAQWQALRAVCKVTSTTASPVGT